MDEAHELLLKYAKINRATVDPERLRRVMEHVKKADLRKTDSRATKERTKGYRVLQLFRTSKLRKRTLICCFNW